jgi:CheY-like chemotaxis protein
MTGVLLLDSDGSSARKVLRSLRAEGGGCRWLSDGSEALDVVRKDPEVRVLIVHDRLKGMNAGDFLAELERDPGLCSAPVVIIADQPSVLTDALRASRVQVLCEPFSDSEVLEAVLGARQAHPDGASRPIEEAD